VFVNLTVDGSTLPELRIEGYASGQLVTAMQMSSDPSHDRLALSVEDSTILGDGSDATRFTFRAVDAFGNQRPYVQGDVSLSLSGPARLVAENPFSFATYGGVGGGLIQSIPGTGGPVVITAAHPTLGQASATVAVQGARAAGANGFSGATPRLVNPVRPPSRSKIRATLAPVLAPGGANARIGRLLRHRGYTFTYAAPFAGTLTIEWHQLAGRPHHGRARLGPKVATASLTTRKAARIQAPVRLTARGRRLLAQGGGRQLVAKARFAPTGHPSASASKIINLRH
jgi:hypothetical protein